MRTYAVNAWDESERQPGSGSRIVTMTQPALSLITLDVTRGSGTCSRVRGTLPEPKKSAALAVVANILGGKSLRMAFVNCDDLTQQFAPATFLLARAIRLLHDGPAFADVKFVLSAAGVRSACRSNNYNALDLAGVKDCNFSKLPI